MQVTPGVVLTNTENITVADLNLLGTPTVALEPGDISEITTDIQNTLGNGVAGKNYLLNAAFDLWTRGTSPVACPTATQTFRADDWWCEPETVVSAQPTYGQGADSVHTQSLYCAQITGASGVGAVDFGQNLQPRVAAVMADAVTPANSSCVFTFEIQNNTGASFTPVVQLDVCNSAGVYTAFTNKYQQNATGGAVANGATQVYQQVINTATFAAAMRNGGRIYVTFPSGTLNATSQFVNVYNCKLEVGATATPRYYETLPLGQEGITSSGSTGGTERNFLYNGDFAELLWGANATASGSVQTWVARGWWARPGAGTNSLSYIQATDAPNSLTAFCAKLIGSSGLSSAVVDFGQDLRAGNAAMLTQQVVFSCWVKNLTSAQFTPTLMIDTPNSFESWGSVTNQVSQTLAPCPTNVWTLVSYAFSALTMPNIANGCRIYLRFGTGVLGSGSNAVEIAQAKIELGTQASTFEPVPRFDAVSTVSALNMGLLLWNTSSSLLSMSWDGLTLTSANGEPFWSFSQSITGVSTGTTGANALDTGTIAANAWYTVWAISDGGSNTAGLISLSATAPALPSGYRFQARLGYFRTDGSSNIINFWQNGRLVWQKPQILFTAAGPQSAGTYEAVSVPAGGTSVLQGLVPPNARHVIGTAAITGSGANPDVMSFAGNSAGLGQAFVGNYTTPTAYFASVAPGTSQNLYDPGYFRVPLISAQQFYWAAYATTANKRVEIVGYEI